MGEKYGFVVAAAAQLAEEDSVSCLQTGESTNRTFMLLKCR